MANSAARLTPASPSGKTHTAARDPAWLKVLLLVVTVGFVGLFLVLPLAVIFFEAFRKGLTVYADAFQTRDSWQSIKLTLIATGISLPLNLVFGLAASWAIAKFDFKGKSLLITLIDLPFAVSPVISGMIFVLVFGLQGWFALARGCGRAW